MAQDRSMLVALMHLRLVAFPELARVCTVLSLDCLPYSKYCILKHPARMAQTLPILPVPRGPGAFAAPPSQAPVGPQAHGPDLSDHQSGGLALLQLSPFHQQPQRPQPAPRTRQPDAQVPPAATTGPRFNFEFEAGPAPMGFPPELPLPPTQLEVPSLPPPPPPPSSPPPPPQLQERQQSQPSSPDKHPPQQPEDELAAMSLQDQDNLPPRSCSFDEAVPVESQGSFGYEAPVASAVDGPDTAEDASSSSGSGSSGHRAAPDALWQQPLDPLDWRRSTSPTPSDVSCLFDMSDDDLFLRCDVGHLDNIWFPPGPVPASPPSF
jgi:hypothetical protein